MHRCVTSLGFRCGLILHDAIFAQETVVSSSEDPTLWREITDMEAAWCGARFDGT